MIQSLYVQFLISFIFGAARIGIKGIFILLDSNVIAGYNLTLLYYYEYIPEFKDGSPPLASTLSFLVRYWFRIRASTGTKW